MDMFNSYVSLPKGRYTAKKKGFPTKYAWFPVIFPLNQSILVGGWPTPLKNMKVSWDDEIPNIWKSKIHVPNHQPIHWIIILSLAALVT